MREGHFTKLPTLSVRGKELHVRQNHAALSNVAPLLLAKKKCTVPSPEAAKGGTVEEESLYHPCFTFDGHSRINS